MSPRSLQDVKTIKFWQALLAEFLGVFLLVVVGCGSCAKFDPNQPTDIVQISLGFGLSVGTIVWAIAHVSGGHINPAVTAGFMFTRKISFIRYCRPHRFKCLTNCLMYTLAHIILNKFVNKRYKDFSLHLNNVSTLPYKTRNCYLWDTKCCFRNFGDVNEVPYAHS